VSVSVSIYHSFIGAGWFLTTKDTKDTKVTLIDADPFSRRVIGCAIEVHRTLGPGLLETIYEACLCRELSRAGLAHVRQRKLPVIYQGEPVDCDLIPDLIVEENLLLEIKAVQSIHPLHEAQLLTYLRVSGLHVGLILNFNEVRLVDGIRRCLL
jgi:GxxExxY protein